jgi:two-component system, chemotaxis family, response regulator PixH
LKVLPKGLIFGLKIWLQDFDRDFEKEQAMETVLPIDKAPELLHGYLLDFDEEPDLRKTVLLIDDLSSELELLSEYLRQGGFNVITASNGAEGFQKALSHQPDVILTDMVMPVMSGLELCRMLKKTAETTNIPIVACTTRSRNVDKAWAEKQGVVTYLIKPCTQTQVVNAIQAVLI